MKTMIFPIFSLAIVLLGAMPCLAIIITAFTDTDTFIQRATDIVIAKCLGPVADPSGYDDGLYPVDVEVLLVVKNPLKNEKNEKVEAFERPKAKPANPGMKLGKAKIATIYTMEAGKTYLLTNMGGSAHGTEFLAIPELSVVKLPPSFRLEGLKDKTLKQQVQTVFAARRQENERQQRRLEEEKKLLDKALGVPTHREDLRKIQPPGGAPLDFGRPGTEIKVEALKQATKRLESAPQKDPDKWVAELERIMDEKLQGELAKQACRTYFVSRMSVAFDDLRWNAKSAGSLFKRAQTMSASEAKVWKEAFEVLLKKDIGQTATTNSAGGPSYAVPLVLIPVDALHERQKYSAERGKKYLWRLKQLTGDDVSLWKDKVDAFEGTKLDAAVNIILLDDFFDKDKFQRDKFKAAIGARKK